MITENAFNFKLIKVAPPVQKVQNQHPLMVNSLLQKASDGHVLLFATEELNNWERQYRRKIARAWYSRREI